MKKFCLLILIILLFISCAGVNVGVGVGGKVSTVFYEKIPVGASVYLRTIKLKPGYILSDLSEEVPELIRTCLVNNGFTIAEEQSDAAYELDLILNSRSWQYQYKFFESVTLSMRFYRNGILAAYRLYTEDSERSINSFSWTLELIEKNIRKFTSDNGNEE